MRNSVDMARRRSASACRDAIVWACEVLEQRQMLSTWYVAPSPVGNDSAAGGPTTPFLHIQKAIAALGTGGGTIYIGAGTYVLGDGTTNNTAGIVLPSQGGVTLTSYDGTVDIVGGLTVGSTWISDGSGVYQTTLTGPLASSNNGTGQSTVQQVFENFAPGTTSQIQLTQYGSSFGYTDSHRVQNLLTGGVTTLPAGAFYISGYSNTLYVHLSDGGMPGITGHIITAANPSVLGLISYTGSPTGDLISKLNFEISDNTGIYASSATAQSDFQNGAGYSDDAGAVRVPNSSTLMDSNIYYAATVGAEVSSTAAKVIGCDIYYAGQNGVGTDTSANFLLQQCDIEYSNVRHFDASWGGSGVKIIPKSYGKVTQCQIAYSNGSGLWSDTNFNTNHVPLIFSDNYVHDNIPTVADYQAGGATFMEGEAGIKVEVSSYVDVINNIVVRNGQIGILFAGCENCVAENNTIVDNYGFAAFMADTDGERGVVDGQTWVLKNNVIRNNIIANNSTTYDLVITSLPASDQAADGESQTSNNTSDYNLIYHMGLALQIADGDPVSDGTNNSLSTLHNIFTSLATWRTHSGLDVHSIDQDPLFAPNAGTWSYNQTTDAYNPGSLYQLGPGSPCINAGGSDETNSGFSNDYNAVAPTAPYDIGACEYNGATGSVTTVVPTLDPTSWVDDTLPAGADVYASVHSVNGYGTDVHSEGFNWVNSTSMPAPYNWNTGIVSHSGGSAIETTSTGLTNYSDVMQFQGATGTMNIVSASDILYAWVLVAGNSAANGLTPATTTPDEFAIGFFDGSHWHTAYVGANSMSGIYSNTSSTEYAKNGSIGTYVNTWTALSFTAGSIGLSAGQTISGLSLASHDGETAWDDIGIIHSPLILTGPAFYLKLDADGQHLDIWNSTTDTGTISQQVLDNSFGEVQIQGTTGADAVVVDFSAGDPLSNIGLSDTGGGNGAFDDLTIIGSTANDAVVASTGQFTFNGIPINSSNVRQVIFTPGTGIDSLSVSSGKLILAPPAGATAITPMTFSSINIGAGARLSMATPATSASRSVLVTSNLTLAQTSGIYSSTLDLSGNDLILRGGSLSTTTAEIASAFASIGGLNWLGEGITSAAAASNSAHLTTLGIIQNSVDGTATGAPLYGSGTTLGSFDGINTIDTDVLVKYTYWGDCDLDGRVDGSDYTRIDSGYPYGNTWYNGDLNYDQVVNGSDYTLMDNAFNSQGARLATEIATPSDAVNTFHLPIATPAADNPGASPALPANSFDLLTTANRNVADHPLRELSSETGPAVVGKVFHQYLIFAQASAEIQMDPDSLALNVLSKVAGDVCRQPVVWQFPV